jgi:anti-sigma B factor antagonist
MNSPLAKLLVYVGERFACVKIVGRANFNSSMDFRTLMGELRQKGYTYFVLELSECVLMDSTFLGVLAGLCTRKGQGPQTIQLLNPNARITELLENLGILHLFKVKHGNGALPADAKLDECAPGDHTKLETSEACLEAHQKLVEVNPANSPKFKDVTQFLIEDVKRLRGAA